MTIAQRSLYQVLRHKVDRPQTLMTGRFRLQQAGVNNSSHIGGG